MVISTHEVGIEFEAWQIVPTQSMFEMQESLSLHHIGSRVETLNDCLYPEGRKLNEALRNFFKRTKLTVVLELHDDGSVKVAGQGKQA